MTDVKLIKDCGLYPSYKKIIDFTGTKSQIISKQISWVNTFTHRDEFDVNYNKFQNKLVMPIDYEEALTYTYCVLSNITGTDDNPQFFFVDEVENLTNGIDNAEPNVAFYLSLDPIMTYMGDWSISESHVVREHKDRWSANSNLPIRITPSLEGSYGFEEFVSSDRFVMDRDHYGGDPRTVLIVIVYTDATGAIKYYAFPDSMLGRPGFRSFGHSTGSYPSINQVMSGDILDDFTLDPNGIVNISVYPIYGETLVYSASTQPNYVEDVTLSGATYVYSADTLKVIMDITSIVAYGRNENTRTVSISINSSQKPTDGSNYSKNYEPQNFVEPIYRYSLNDGINDLFDIPDNVILKSGGTLNFKIVSQMASKSPGVLVYIGDSIDEAIGNNCITFIPAIPLEIANDLWRAYAIESLDADRQMVINYSIKNAIDNLIYMSYGGALVGSRSMGKEGLYQKPGRTDYYTQTRIGKNGRKYQVRTYDEIEGGLTASGKRVLGATALAGVASIATSLIDSAVAWENQLQTENKIKNTASGLLQGGASLSRYYSGAMFIKLIVRKLDSINSDKITEAWRKYGYYVDISETPNIVSRKYFNYIMTDGAIIRGSICQEIRDAIREIFDSGVTIFHYDSGDTTTRNLEYTDKENIEVSLL